MKSAAEVVQNDLDYICGKLASELPEMAGKRLLITGGAGFLGYYLVQTILHWNEQHSQSLPIQLSVYDNFMRGTPGWLEDLRSHNGLEIRKHDIIDPLPADIGAFDFIIHAASVASPIYYRRNPIATMDANVGGFRHLLDYCVDQQNRGTPVSGFLFYSTSEIYGDPTPENIPTPETYRGNVSCTGPRACYDESKRYGETLAVNFTSQYNLPIRIARPFNNYGPGLKITDKRALPDFARNVLDGEDIILFSDGSPTRTFCYVADAVVGYYKVLLRGTDGEPYNIGIDRPEVSIRHLAETVIEVAKELFDYHGKLVFQVSEDKEYLTDNPNRRCPVIDKAREQLGYEPAVSLEEGVRRSLLWYAEHNDTEEE